MFSRFPSCFPTRRLRVLVQVLLVHRGTLSKLGVSIVSRRMNELEFLLFVMSGSSWLSLGLFSMMGMISSEWNPSGGMPLIISMLRMRNSLENRKVIKTAFILCVWITDLDPRSLINVLSDESPKLSLVT